MVRTARHRNAACLICLAFLLGQEALGAAPAEMLIEQGNELLVRQPERAAALFTEACQQVRAPGCVYGLGLAYQALARYDQAIEAYRTYQDEAARGAAGWQDWLEEVKRRLDFCLRRIHEIGRESERAGNFDRACERFATFDRLSEGVVINGRDWNRRVLEPKVWTTISEEKRAGRRSDAQRHLEHYEVCFCEPVPIIGQHCQEVPALRASLLPPPPPPVWKRPWFIATMSVVGLGVGAAVVGGAIAGTRPAEPPVFYP